MLYSLMQIATIQIDTLKRVMCIVLSLLACAIFAQLNSEFDGSRSVTKTFRSGLVDDASAEGHQWRHFLN
jgi:hypothetical protein